MALAITSFPVPVSPWIKTAESTDATLSTSAINTRNFGLDPIKSKVVIALLLYECAKYIRQYTPIIGRSRRLDNYRFIYTGTNQIGEFFRKDARIQNEKAG